MLKTKTAFLALNNATMFFPPLAASAVYEGAIIAGRVREHTAAVARPSAQRKLTGEAPLAHCPKHAFLAGLTRHVVLELPLVLQPQSLLRKSKLLTLK